jgi:hypothetical protein
MVISFHKNYHNKLKLWVMLQCFVTTTPIQKQEVLHVHVKAAMLDGRTTETLSPEEYNSFSGKYILLLLPSSMVAVT